VDNKTKILAVVFGVILAGAGAAQFIYPRWIKPLVSIEDTIALREKRLSELEEVQSQVDWAIREYRAMINRSGSTDVKRVTTDVQTKLSALIEARGFSEADVTPGQPTRDRKTGITKRMLTVKAVGSLESAILFLRDVSELPQVLRVLNPTIYPVGGGGKDKFEEVDRAAISVPIQIAVMPKQRLVGEIADEDISQPEKFIRHDGRNYASIWTGKPLIVPIPMDPLVVTPKEALVSVDFGQRAYVEARATGGDANYTFTWAPADGLENPNLARSRVDTTKITQQRYSVTVVDGRGNRSEAFVEVEVRPAASDRTAEQPPSEQPPPGPKRWPDGRQMKVTMTLIRTEGGSRLSEIMVSNERSRQTEYYTVGDEFDGGHLVYVHPTGALASRTTRGKDEYFIYPIGAKLDQDIAADIAGDFPELQQAAKRHHELKAAAEPKPVSKSQPPEPAPAPAATQAPVQAEPSPSPSTPPAVIENPLAGNVVTQPVVGQPVEAVGGTPLLLNRPPDEEGTVVESNEIGPPRPEGSTGNTVASPHGVMPGSAGIQSSEAATGGTIAPAPTQVPPPGAEPNPESAPTGDVAGPAPQTQENSPPVVRPARGSRRNRPNPSGREIKPPAGSEKATPSGPEGNKGGTGGSQETPPDNQGPPKKDEQPKPVPPTGPSQRPKSSPGS